MTHPSLPDNVLPIEDNEPFSFACHPQVSCFTDCCRQLELALTPYDILRLKRETGLSSTQFLDDYVIMEQEGNDIFPRFYLTMVDDGRASCVFVADSGCTVYPGRPGACRTYPMGRAAVRHSDDSIRQFFVLLNEPHCHGFSEEATQTAKQYSREQGLEEYNRFNDSVAAILQHEQIRQGKRLTEEQKSFFVLALYDLDNFRSKLDVGQLPDQQAYTDNKDNYLTDEQLLTFGIEWLQRQLFTP